MTDWATLIPDAPFDWEMIPLDGRKRPIDPETGQLMNAWQSSPVTTPKGCQSSMAWSKPWA